MNGKVCADHAEQLHANIKVRKLYANREEWEDNGIPTTAALWGVGASLDACYSSMCKFGDHSIVYFQELVK